MLRAWIAALVGGAALAAVGVAGATVDDWERTRKDVIDPLNSELHRHLPTYLKSRDLTGVLDLYTTATGTGLRWTEPTRVYPGREETVLRWNGDRGSEPIRARYEKILEIFAAIDKAELRIHRIHWKNADDDGYPAEVRLLVRGTRKDGSRAQLDQRATLHIRQQDKLWRISAEEVTGREMVLGAAPRFELATEAAGLVDVHENEGSPRFRLVGDVTNSSGSAVADVDRDGCEDVFLAGSPRSALYRNDCRGGFTDVSAEAGIPRPFPSVPTGVVFFDYDNDGWPDLYVSAVTGGDRLFHNTGKGRFEDVTKRAGIPAGRWASMPIVADYDRDGFLDVYVIRMGDHEKTAPEPNYQADNGLPNTLLHNQGDGTFVDVSEDAGLADTGWGLAGGWADYDDDGWPDVYVGNEFGFNALYHNQRDGTFRNVAKAAGARDRGAAMGISWGDYDNDGDLDVFVSNMYANSRWALFHPDFPVPAPWYYRLLGVFLPREFEQHAQQIIEETTRGSTLLQNDGGGRFTDVTDRARVRDGQWGWASQFVDYDNDGWLDLYAVNGFVTGPIPDDV
jgi:hypothetical protein